MRQLEEESWIGTNASQTRSVKDLSTAKHCIGRLAHHIRASQQLLEDSYRLAGLFESYHVLPTPIMRGVIRPEQDSQTTLDAILKRMLAEKDDRYVELQEALSTMDQKFHIFDRIVGYHESKTWRPQVHAEIHVLEHFFKQTLSYVDNDRYIGCSKPACLCCKLYIRYHPARCVEPESHQKVYTNWSPPNLEAAGQDPLFAQQRDIMIEITHRIRENVIEQLYQRSISQKRRNDSLTAITTSGAYLIQDPSTMDSVFTLDVLDDDEVSGGGGNS